MKSAEHTRAQWVAIGASILTLVWIVLATQGMTSDGVLGYDGDAEGMVTGVTPGSAAGASGLRVGDRILEIEGTTGDLDPGQIVVFEVERQGETLRLEATAQRLPRGVRIERTVSGVIALGILLCGLTAFLLAESLPALLLLLYSIGRAVHDSGRPSSSSALSDELILSFVLLAMMLASPLLLHLSLIHPPRRKGNLRTGGLILLYGPVVVALVLAGVKLALPALGPVFYQFVSAAASLYLLLAITTVIVRFWKAGPEDRRTYRLGVILTGTLAALLPYTAVLLVEGLFPSVHIPGGGSHFYTFFFILLPAAFAHSIVGSRRA